MDESGSILLRIALEAFDRLIAAREEIGKSGNIVVEDPVTHQRWLNPALKLEKEARAGMLMAWRMLRIDIEPPKSIGRPPGPRKVE